METDPTREMQGDQGAGRWGDQELLRTGEKLGDRQEIEEQRKRWGIRENIADQRETGEPEK